MAATTLIAADREAWGADAATAALDAFLDLDRRMKSIVTDWKMKDAETINDHTDAAYDAGVLDRLSALHGDVDAWRVYQTAVFARTETALESLPLSRFSEKAMDRPPADKLKGAFIALLVPEGEIRVSDVCEAYLFQHAVRHLGELEHARALVGLGGLS